MKKILLLIIILLLSQNTTAEKFKFATYNIFFLDQAISQERKVRLQKIIDHLDADIIAFQEIDSEAALKNILPDDYTIAMIDDPEEILEVALAVRPPFKIIHKRYVFPDETYENAFPRNRDLLQVEVKGPNQNYFFLVHHTKSRRGGRVKTDKRREAASILIVDYIREKLDGELVILLGDFNDNPDDRSVNILEMGDSTAVGGPDELEDRFLYNTTEKLLEEDYCSYGIYKYDEQMADSVYRPVINGARSENNKWRNREFNYYKDVQIKAILFDQILVSMNLKNNIVSSGVYSGTEAVQGTETKIKFIEGDIHYTRRGSLPSDHVPVWVEISEK